MGTDDAATSRRTVLRAAGWTAPVVLATIAAPAFAASTSPIVVTATDGGSGNSKKLRLIFNGGTGLLTIVGVTRAGTAITMSPTSVSAGGGTSDGPGQSYVAGGTYTVTYTYQLVTTMVIVTAA